MRKFVPTLFIVILLGMFPNLRCQEKGGDIREYAAAYIERGLAFFIKGNNDLAISDYNKAVDLNPKDSETYNTRGVLFDVQTLTL